MPALGEQDQHLADLGAMRRVGLRRIDQHHGRDQPTSALVDEQPLVAGRNVGELLRQLAAVVAIKASQN